MPSKSSKNSKKNNTSEKGVEKIEKKVIEEKPAPEAIETSAELKKCENECSCCKLKESILWTVLSNILSFVIITILFIIGFGFFLIIKENTTVTFDLCKQDATKCIENMYKAILPYIKPSNMIQFFRERGYIA